MKAEKTTIRAGFTLVELAVVIVIIGVLAAFAVPRFRASVERSKAAEAFNYLSAIQAAQERYHARQGIYAADVNDLDVQFSAPKYFTVAEVAGEDLETAWSLTLTRTGAAAGYGEYTVIFTQEGFDETNSTIADEDHVDINPMQT
ncbi:MAG: prepilin-type N-terminal cleavage/methylation domain-containing protein [Phycisphaerae bacterium]|jgi:prepilin-type N-terminal cleavage/methylation domain-containing protein